MYQLILYYQPECHLCDDAEVLLQAAGVSENCQKIDIENDLELLKTYGIHVPVLKRLDNDERLFWPFDASALTDFLGAK